MAIDLSKYGLLVSQGDKQQALYQGLLGLGSQLMAGSAPSTQPGGFGRGMAAGGQAFQQGYRGYLNDAIGKQMQGLQAVNMQQQMEAQQADAERKAQMRLARDRLVNTQAMGGRDMAGKPVDRGALLAQAYPDAYGQAAARDMFREVTPYTNYGKIQSDLDAGVITPEQARAEASRLVSTERKTAKDAAGYLRYLDDGARVFPGVEKPMDPEKDKSFDNETKLRGEFTKGAEDFLKVRDAYSRIVVSADQPDAAGDLAMIFNYMKMLDPGSTVREGEFATAQQATGVPGQVVSMYNRVLRGERLNTDQRAQFVNRSQKLYDQQAKLYERHKDRYGNLAKMYKLDPNRVIYDLAGGVPGRDSARDAIDDLPPLPPGFQVIK